MNHFSPWHDNGISPPSPPPPVVINNEEEYEIKEILNSHYIGQELQYLVHWKGYGPQHDTWKPAHNLANSLEHVTIFHNKYSICL